MTTTKETCPKCGARVDTAFDGITYFDCLSTNERPQNSFEQSELCKARCRITELEKEVEKLREVLTESVTVMNGCKGLLFKSSEFMNRLYACVDRASALLEKKGSERKN
jgi:hypothetical protein